MAKDPTITRELEKILLEFDKEEKEIANKCFMQAGKEAKRDVVARSPGHGEYAQGWTVRNKRTNHTIETVVYNKKQPGLTHLLERTHVIRNAYGSYGRTYEGHGQHPHIEKAQEAAERFLLDQLKSKL